MPNIDLTPGNTSLEPGCMAMVIGGYEGNLGKVVRVGRRIRFCHHPHGSKISDHLWEISPSVADYNLNTGAPLGTPVPGEFEGHLMRLNHPGNLDRYVAEDGCEISITFGSPEEAH